MWNRSKEKALERQERRTQRLKREDDAGKLSQKAPDLATLSLAVHETRPEGCVTDTHHIRRFVVEHAPALFEVACSDPYCEDGGYDITRDILYALASHKLTFESEQRCRGHCGANDCGRSLRVVGTATYREPTHTVRA